ncbi:MAG: prolipoprotein diacylglyceryl transferase [Paludibacteraceae bacterium]|nr:prolipoprotein diacylglyceryl transferase [Paludibacteraceae bacterium]
MLNNLLYVTWDVDPILIHFGNGGIRWYGLLWAIGIYLCYLVQVWLYRHEKCPEDWADKIFIWMTLGVIIGARVGHCWFYEWHLNPDPIQIFTWTINYRNPYIENPFLLLKIWEGGLSSHGGGIGLILSALMLNKKHFSKRPEYQTSMLWILDRLCIGVCITATLIRFGNLMNSEIYGGPTDLPWGFIFVRDGQTVPCHPTQIYEMLYCLVAMAITWSMYWFTNARRREGLLIGTFFLVVFVTRFCLEFIKNDQEAFEANYFLNMGQVLSIPFIIAGLWLVIRAFRRPMLPDTTQFPLPAPSKKK